MDSKPIVGTQGVRLKCIPDGRIQENAKETHVDIRRTCTVINAALDVLFRS